MSYQKYKPTQIFTGTELLPEGYVLVMTQDEKVEAIISQEDAGEDVEHLEGILSPGFINCHCHLELSHLKNLIPKHTGMVGFIQQVMAKRGEALEIIEEACQQANYEMEKNGIAAVGDICNTTNSLSTKLKSNIYYHNFIEVSGFVPQSAAKRMQDALPVYNEFKQHFSTQTSIVPHAPYSVSKQLFDLIKEQSSKQIITMHNQEGEDENLFFKHKQGGFLNLFKDLGIDISFFKATQENGLPFALPYLQKAKQTILVHNGYMQKEDAQILKQLNNLTNETQFWMCLCVNANSYIGNQSPQEEIFKMFENEWVIGTDSLASNTELNLLKEMKEIRALFPTCSLAQVLKMATSNGANALGVSHLYGSFKKGLKPGKILVNNLLN